MENLDLAHCSSRGEGCGECALSGDEQPGGARGSGVCPLVGGPAVGGFFHASGRGRH